MAESPGISREEVMRELAGVREVIGHQVGAIQQLVNERDRRYSERAEASALAVKDALAAQEKLSQVVNEAANKAIDKAETAQSAYNQRSNEFRAALDDAQKTLMPRQEALAEFNRVAERFDDWKKELETYKQNQAAEIRSLRESRAGYTGIWQAVVGAAVLAGLLGAVIGIIGHALVK
jgi:hypothetical protein